MSENTSESCDGADDLGERIASLKTAHRELEKRVERSESRRAAIVGAAITVALAAFGATRYIVLLEGRINELERRIDRIESRGRPAEPFPLVPSLTTEPPLVGMTEGPL